MINKTDFVNAINSMMLIEDYQNDKNRLYKKYNADGFLIEPDNNATVLRLLELQLPNESYKEILEEFCITNNYGRGKNKNICTDVNGQKILISSAEELYNYIFKKQLGSDEVSVNME